MFVTAGDGPPSAAERAATTALDALIGSVRLGASAGALHAEAVAALAPDALHPVLGGSIGHGIGLALHEGAEFTAAADATLIEDGVYALQVGVAAASASHAVVSAIVRATANGAEVLARSPSGG
jgi:Xaa-Pro aminopeptidase